VSRRYHASSVEELRQALLAIDANCQAFIDRYTSDGDSRGFILAQICRSYAREVLYEETGVCAGTAHEASATSDPAG
jgi:hypothetical protein